MNKALETTANVLTITSNLLAIGIELGIIAGGYLVYKKYLAEPKPEEKAATIKVIASENETDILKIPYPPKQTVKDKFRKVGAIVRAVLE